MWNLTAEWLKNVTAQTVLASGIIPNSENIQSYTYQYLYCICYYVIYILNIIKYIWLYHIISDYICNMMCAWLASLGSPIWCDWIVLTFTFLSARWCSCSCCIYPLSENFTSLHVLIQRLPKSLLRSRSRYFRWATWTAEVRMVEASRAMMRSICL